MKNSLSDILEIIWGILRSALIGWTIGTLIGTALNPLSPLAPINHVDPQTLPYTKTFIEHANKYGALNVSNWNKVQKLRVNIGKLPWYYFFSKNTIGVCDTETTQVILEESNWKEANQLEKEALVFHELAHCILDQDHVNGEDHIMNPVILSSVTYSIYYQQLMDKLFVCSKNCPVVKFNRGRYL